LGRSRTATDARATTLRAQRGTASRRTRFTPELPPAYHSPPQQRRSPRRGLEALLGAAGSA